MHGEGIRPPTGRIETWRPTSSPDLTRSRRGGKRACHPCLKRSSHPREVGEEPLREEGREGEEEANTRGERESQGE